MGKDGVVDGGGDLAGRHGVDDGVLEEQGGGGGWHTDGKRHLDLFLKVTSKKWLVWIILAIVFPPQIKINKDMFVYIQQSTCSDHVCS